MADIDVQEAWCPVCRQRVKLDPFGYEHHGDFGFYLVFKVHVDPNAPWTPAPPCPGSGRKVQDPDYGYVNKDGDVVPAWGFL